MFCLFAVAINLATYQCFLFILSSLQTQLKIMIRVYRTYIGYNVFLQIAFSQQSQLPTSITLQVFLLYILKCNSAEIPTQKQLQFSEVHVIIYNNLHALWRSVIF
jgi:hypothetical protein